MFSDIVTGVELPESVRENCELWAECIGGAEQQERYIRRIEAAGMKIETVERNESYEFSLSGELGSDPGFVFSVENVNSGGYSLPDRFASEGQLCVTQANGTRNSLGRSLRVAPRPVPVVRRAEPVRDPLPRVA